MKVALTKPSGFPIFLGNVFQWFLNVRISFVLTLFTKLVGVIFSGLCFFSRCAGTTNNIVIIAYNSNNSIIVRIMIK